MFLTLVIFFVAIGIPTLVNLEPTYGYDELTIAKLTPVTTFYQEAYAEQEAFGILSSYYFDPVLSTVLLVMPTTLDDLPPEDPLQYFERKYSQAFVIEEGFVETDKPEMMLVKDILLIFQQGSNVPLEWEEVYYYIEKPIFEEKSKENQFLPSAYADSIYIEQIGEQRIRNDITDTSANCSASALPAGGVTSGSGSTTQHTSSSLNGDCQFTVYTFNPNIPRELINAGFINSMLFGGTQSVQDSDYDCGIGRMQGVLDLHASIGQMNVSEAWHNGTTGKSAWSTNFNSPVCRSTSPEFLSADTGFGASASGITHFIDAFETNLHADGSVTCDPVDETQCFYSLAYIDNDIPVRQASSKDANMINEYLKIDINPVSNKTTGHFQMKEHSNFPTGTMDDCKFERIGDKFNINSATENADVGQCIIFKSVIKNNVTGKSFTATVNATGSGSGTMRIFLDVMDGAMDMGTTYASGKDPILLPVTLSDMKENELRADLGTGKNHRLGIMEVNVPFSGTLQVDPEYSSSSESEITVFVGFRDNSTDGSISLNITSIGIGDGDDFYDFDNPIVQFNEHLTDFANPSPIKKELDTGYVTTNRTQLLNSSAWQFADWVSFGEVSASFSVRTAGEAGQFGTVESDEIELDVGGGGGASGTALFFKVFKQSEYFGHNFTIFWDGHNTGATGTTPVFFQIRDGSFDRNDPNDFANSVNGHTRDHLPSKGGGGTLGNSGQHSIGGSITTVGINTTIVPDWSLSELPFVTLMVLINDFVGSMHGTLHIQNITSTNGAIWNFNTGDTYFAEGVCRPTEGGQCGLLRIDGAGDFPFQVAPQSLPAPKNPVLSGIVTPTTSLELDWVHDGINTTGYRIYRTSTEPTDTKIIYDTLGSEDFAEKLNLVNQSVAHSGLSVVADEIVSEMVILLMNDTGMPVTSTSLIRGALYADATTSTTSNATIALSKNTITTQFLNSTLEPFSFIFRGADLVNLTSGFPTDIGFGVFANTSLTGDVSVGLCTGACAGAGSGRTYDTSVAGGTWLEISPSFDIPVRLTAINQTKLQSIAIPFVNDTGSLDTNFTDTTTVAGNTYFYRVVPLNGDIEGDSIVILNGTEVGNFNVILSDFTVVVDQTTTTGVQQIFNQTVTDTVSVEEEGAQGDTESIVNLMSLTYENTDAGDLLAPSGGTFDGFIGNVFTSDFGEYPTSFRIKELFVNWGTTLPNPSITGTMSAVILTGVTDGGSVGSTTLVEESDGFDLSTLPISYPRQPFSGSGDGQGILFNFTGLTDLSITTDTLIGIKLVGINATDLHFTGWSFDTGDGEGECLFQNDTDAFGICPFTTLALEIGIIAEDTTDFETTGGIAPDKLVLHHNFDSQTLFNSTAFPITQSNLFKNAGTAGDKGDISIFNTDMHQSSSGESGIIAGHIGDGAIFVDGNQGEGQFEIGFSDPNRIEQFSFLTSNETDTYSINFWINGTWSGIGGGGGGVLPLISNTGQDGVDGIFIGVDDGGDIIFDIKSDGTEPFDEATAGSASLTDDVWSMVSIIMEKSNVTNTAKICLNGDTGGTCDLLDRDAPFTTKTVFENRLSIGDQNPDSFDSILTSVDHRFFAMDELCIWEDYKLTTTDINALFNSGAGIECGTISAISTGGINVTLISAPAPPMSAPANFTLTLDNINTEHELSWNAVSGATDYVVQRLSTERQETKNNSLGGDNNFGTSVQGARSDHAGIVEGDIVSMVSLKTGVFGSAGYTDGIHYSGLWTNVTIGQAGHLFATSRGELEQTGFQISSGTRLSRDCNSGFGVPDLGVFVFNLTGVGGTDGYTQWHDGTYTDGACQAYARMLGNQLHNLTGAEAGNLELAGVQSFNDTGSFTVIKEGVGTGQFLTASTGTWSTQDEIETAVWIMNKTWVNITTTALTSFDDTTTNDYNSYFYRIIPTNSGGEGSPSIILNGTLSKPPLRVADLNGTDNGSGTVDLVWTEAEILFNRVDSNDPVQGYIIQRNIVGNETTIYDGLAFDVNERFMKGDGTMTPVTGGQFTTGGSPSHGSDASHGGQLLNITTSMNITRMVIKLGVGHAVDFNTEPDLAGAIFKFDPTAELIARTIFPRVGMTGDMNTWADGDDDNHNFVNFAFSPPVQLEAGEYGFVWSSLNQQTCNSASCGLGNADTGDFKFFFDTTNNGDADGYAIGNIQTGGIQGFTLEEIGGTGNKTNDYAMAVYAEDPNWITIGTNLGANNLTFSDTSAPIPPLTKSYRILAFNDAGISEVPTLLHNPQGTLLGKNANSTHFFAKDEFGRYSAGGADDDSPTGGLNIGEMITFAVPPPAPATVPKTITDLNATQTNSIFLNWTAPDDGGSPITGYEIGRARTDIARNGTYMDFLFREHELSGEINSGDPTDEVILSASEGFVGQALNVTSDEEVGAIALSLHRITTTTCSGSAFLQGTIFFDNATRVGNSTNTFAVCDVDPNAPPTIFQDHVFIFNNTEIFSGNEYVFGVEKVGTNTDGDIDIPASTDRTLLADGFTSRDFSSPPFVFTNDTLTDTAVSVFILNFTTLVADTGNTNTNFTDTSCPAGITCYYRAQGINAIGTAGKSNIVNATETGLETIFNSTSDVNNIWSYRVHDDEFSAGTATSGACFSFPNLFHCGGIPDAQFGTGAVSGFDQRPKSQITFGTTANTPIPQGDAYFFKTFTSNAILNQDIEVFWELVEAGGNSRPMRIQVYDGAYIAENNEDFPYNNKIKLKGGGLLGVCNTGAGGADKPVHSTECLDGIDGNDQFTAIDVDYSLSTEDYITVFLQQEPITLSRTEMYLNNMTITNVAFWDFINAEVTNTRGAFNNTRVIEFDEEAGFYTANVTILVTTPPEPIIDLQVRIENTTAIYSTGASATTQIFDKFPTIITQIVPTFPTATLIDSIQIDIKETGVTALPVGTVKAVIVGDRTGDLTDGSLLSNIYFIENSTNIISTSLLPALATFNFSGNTLLDENDFDVGVGIAIDTHDAEILMDLFGSGSFGKMIGTGADCAGDNLTFDDEACSGVATSDLSGLDIYGGNARAVLNWTAPTDNGDAISGYEILRTNSSQIQIFDERDDGTTEDNFEAFGNSTNKYGIIGQRITFPIDVNVKSLSFGLGCSANPCLVTPAGGTVQAVILKDAPNGTSSFTRIANSTLVFDTSNFVEINDPRLSVSGGVTRDLRTFFQNGTQLTGGVEYIIGLEALDWTGDIATSSDDASDATGHPNSGLGVFTKLDITTGNIWQDNSTKEWGVDIFGLNYTLTEVANTGNTNTEYTSTADFPSEDKKINAYSWTVKAINSGGSANASNFVELSPDRTDSFDAWSYAEHDNQPLFTAGCEASVSPSSDKSLRLTTLPNINIGGCFLFKSFEKNAINDSDIRIVYENFGQRRMDVSVQDGQYDKDIDFPLEAQVLGTKGIGILSTFPVLFDTITGVHDIIYNSTQINYVGSTEDFITVFLTQAELGTGTFQTSDVKFIAISNVGSWNFTQSPRIIAQVNQTFGSSLLNDGQDDRGLVIANSIFNGTVTIGAIVPDQVTNLVISQNMNNNATLDWDDAVDADNYQVLRKVNTTDAEVNTNSTWSWRAFRSGSSGIDATCSAFTSGSGATGGIVLRNTDSGDDANCNLWKFFPRDFINNTRIQFSYTLTHIFGTQFTTRTLVGTENDPQANRFDDVPPSTIGYGVTAPSWIGGISNDGVNPRASIDVNSVAITSVQTTDEFVDLQSQWNVADSDYVALVFQTDDNSLLSSRPDLKIFWINVTDFDTLEQKAFYNFSGGSTVTERNGDCDIGEPDTCGFGRVDSGTTIITTEIFEEIGTPITSDFEDSTIPITGVSTYKVRGNNTVGFGLNSTTVDFGLIQEIDGITEISPNLFIGSLNATALNSTAIKLTWDQASTEHPTDPLTGIIIQRSVGTQPTADFFDDFTTDKGWSSNRTDGSIDIYTATGTINVTKLVTNVPPLHSARISLNIDDLLTGGWNETKWTLRGKVQMNQTTTVTGFILLGVSEVNQQNMSGSASNFACGSGALRDTGCLILSNGNNFWQWLTKNNTGDIGNTNLNLTEIYTLDSFIYPEIVVDEPNIRLTVYSDANYQTVLGCTNDKFDSSSGNCDFEGGNINDGVTSGDILIDGITGQATRWNDLNYLIFGASASAVLGNPSTQGSIHEVSFFNNVNMTEFDSGFVTIATVDDLDTMFTDTGLVVNTEYTYRLKGQSAVSTGAFGENNTATTFSALNVTQTESDIVTILDDEVFDITKVIRNVEINQTSGGDGWTAEFDYRFTASNLPSHGILIFHDVDQDIDTVGINDAIGVFHGLPSSDSLKIHGIDDEQLGGVGIGSSSGISISSSTTYFPRFERVNSTFTELSIFSDSARTTQIAGSPVSLTIPATVEGLRFVSSQTFSEAGGVRTLTGTLDNLNITETDGSFTFIEDFSSAVNWTQTNTGVTITGGEISGWGAGGVDRRVTTDLGLNLTQGAGSSLFVTGDLVTTQETVIITPPTIPEGILDLTGNTVTNTCQLSWSAPITTSTINGYRILRQVDGTGGFVILISNTSNTFTTNTDTGLVNNILYEYDVLAGNRFGFANVSSNIVDCMPIVNDVPSNPSPMIGVEEPNGDVTLTWVEPTNGDPTGYQIQRKIGNGGFLILVNDTGTTSLTFLDTATDPAVEYTWRVAGWNSIGLGAFSNQVTLLMSSPANAPILSGAQNGNQIDLSWTIPASDNPINGYKIDRRINLGSFTTLIANTSTTSTTFIDTNVTKPDTFGYRVRALSSAGEGTVSNVVDIVFGSHLIVHVREQDGSGFKGGGIVKGFNSTFSDLIGLDANSDATFDNLAVFNYNFTFFDDDNYILNKTFNFPSPAGNDTSEFTINALVFDVDCPANGAGTDIRIKVNYTDAKDITAFPSVPVCDSSDQVSWSTQWQGSAVNDTSTMIADFISTVFKTNAEQFLASADIIPTIYNSGENQIESETYVVNMTDVTINFNLFLGRAPSGGGAPSPSPSNPAQPTPSIPDPEVVFGQRLTGLSILSRTHQFAQAGDVIEGTITVNWEGEINLDVRAIDISGTDLDIRFDLTPFPLDQRIEGIGEFAMSTADIRYMIVLPADECSPEIGLTQNCFDPILHTIPLEFEFQRDDQVYEASTEVFVDGRPIPLDIVQLQIILLFFVLIASAVFGRFIRNRARGSTRRTKTKKKKFKKKFDSS